MRESGTKEGKRKRKRKQKRKKQRKEKKMEDTWDESCKLVDSVAYGQTRLSHALNLS